MEILLKNPMGSLKSVLAAILSPILAKAIELRRTYRGRPLTDKELLLKGPKYSRHLSLEVTNICNANCTFCGYQYQERPMQVMPFETFKLAIDQFVAAKGTSLGLTPVVGDALVDKDLVRKVQYAHSFPQIKDIGLTTNGILLTRKRFEELADAGLNYMFISMTGFDREEYKRVYRVDSYMKVVKNLTEIAASDRRQKCFIELSLRTDSLFPSLKPDYRKFKAMGYSINRTALYDNWGGRIKNSDLSGFMFLRPSLPKKTPCSVLYEGTTVLVNGKMTACGCRDLNGGSELDLGTLKEKTLDDAWNDGTLRKIRQRFIDGNPPDICKDCRMYNPITESRAKSWPR